MNAETRISKILFLFPGVLGLLLVTSLFLQGKISSALIGAVILLLGYLGIFFFRLLSSRHSPLGETLVFITILLQIVGSGAVGPVLYPALPWYDTALHFVAGIALATLILPVFKNRVRWNPFPAVIGILGFVALAGVGWEFVEFAFDATLGTSTQESIRDTMADLAADLLGGGLIMLYYLRNIWKM